MPADGGTTKKLYDAKDVTIWGPVWAPDGSCLLIAEGKTGVAGVVDYSDWKLLPVSGGNPIPVEGMAALRQQSTPFPYPKDWVPETGQVIFGSARRLSHIWRVRLLPDGRIEGKAEQLSYGTREHPGPASRDGQIIPFSTSISSLNIYALPMDANRAVVKGEPAPLLDWDVQSYYPSVTDDGRKMVFVSERSGNFDIWMRDNETKEETPLIASPLQETRAILSHDGKRVAWQRYENRKRRVFWKDLPDGAEKVICDDCRSLLGWTADNSGVIVGGGSPEHYSVFEAATGKHLPTAVADPQDANTVIWPIFSPCGKWFAFVLTPERGYTRKLMVSPWRKDRPTRAEDWVQIGTEDDIHHPFWSPDGRVLYYFKYELAERAYCLFGWRFEPATGKPQGSEIVLRHFHGDLRTGVISSIGFGLAPDVLYLPMWEPEGKVWVAEGPAKAK
jgi:Tol biopolymer transport system component